MQAQKSYLQVPTYWEKYTKGDLNLNVQKGVLLIFQNWYFLPTIRKFQTIHKIKQTEQNASFDWYPEEMI